MTVQSNTQIQTLEVELSSKLTLKVNLQVEASGRYFENWQEIQTELKELWQQVWNVRPQVAAVLYIEFFWVFPSCIALTNYKF